jgi:hypothetical protein
MIIYDPQRGEYIDDETGEVIEDRVVNNVYDPIVHEDEHEFNEFFMSALEPDLHDFGVGTHIDDPYLDKLNRYSQLTAYSKYNILYRRLSALWKIKHCLRSVIYVPEYVFDNAAIILRKFNGSVNSMLLAASALYSSMKLYNLPTNINMISQCSDKDPGRIMHVSFEILKRYSFRSKDKAISDELIINMKIDKIRSEIYRQMRILSPDGGSSCIYDECEKLLSSLRELMLRDISFINKIPSERSTASALIYISSKRCHASITSYSFEKKKIITHTILMSNVKYFKRLLNIV